VSPPMRNLALLRWGSRSLWRHVVLLQLIAGVPLSLFFLASDYSDGTLTIASAERSMLASSIGALALAVVGWYFIMPGIRRHKN
jgi:hypothetical protein